MSRRWQAVLGVLLSLVLIYWALHDVSLREVWHHMRGADLWLLLLAIAIQTAAFLIRALRWKVFLRPAIRRPSYYARFASTCIGFMANNVLPARVGEFARAYALSRSQPVSLSASLGSLVVERIFDALILAAFLGLPLLSPDFVAATALGDRLAPKVVMILGLFGGITLVLIAVIRWPGLVVRVFEGTVGRLLPEALTVRITGIMRSFMQGLGALHDPGLIAAGIFWSVVHWAWAGLAFLVGMAAFGIESPGYLGALFLQSVIGFAVAIPSSPGFFGPFEAGARLGLVPFGVEPSQAVSFAVAFHIGSFLPVTVLGVYYVGRLGLSWREVEHSEEIVEETGAPSAPSGTVS